MTRIAILRCGKLPSFVTWDIPNLDELFEEDNLLLMTMGCRAFTVEQYNLPSLNRAISCKLRFPPKNLRRGKHG